MNTIKIGDLVEETGTDSGVWLVTKVYKESRIFGRGPFAQLIIPGKPLSTAYVSFDRLTRVGPWR